MSFNLKFESNSKPDDVTSHVTHSAPNYIWKLFLHVCLIFLKRCAVFEKAFNTFIKLWLNKFWAYLEN